MNYTIYIDAALETHTGEIQSGLQSDLAWCMRLHYLINWRGNRIIEIKTQTYSDVLVGVRGFRLASFATDRWINV